MVLLTIRTPPNEKSTELLEPRSDRTVLRTVDGFHDLHGSFFFGKVSANTGQNFSSTLGIFRFGTKWGGGGEAKKKKKQRKKKSTKKKKKAQMKNSTLTAGSIHHAVGLSSSPPDD